MDARAITKQAHLQEIVVQALRQEINRRADPYIYALTTHLLNNSYQGAHKHTKNVERLIASGTNEHELAQARTVRDRTYTTLARDVLLHDASLEMSKTTHNAYTAAYKHLLRVEKDFLKDAAELYAHLTQMEEINPSKR